MLTKPIHGWTAFQLPGTSSYSLSYLDDIAFDWLEQAINGLTKLCPFCVKGFLEPRRMLCTVSFWNCHIVIEDDDRNPLNKERTTYEISHTNMLEFCQILYQDISSNVEDWVNFVSYDDEDGKDKRTRLLYKLEELNQLIQDRTVNFDEDHCFL